MGLKQYIIRLMMKQGLRYVKKDPDNNIPKLIDLSEKFSARQEHRMIIRMIRNIWQNQDSNWYIYMNKILTQLHPGVLEKLILNFFVNSAIIGTPLAKSLSQKYECNIPWAILMDPTVACNLKCTGCWAAEYDKTANMSLQTLDRIIEEGKLLGIYMYIFSGGEPLVRKTDLIKLAEKHNDCAFLAFSNATLVDEEFAQELARVGNFALAISVEGFAQETDMRRGKGTYHKVLHAMDLLKEEGVGFGFSTCYHSQNTESVGSDEYIDLMIAKGCLFGWYFTYIPLGRNAKSELLASADQREYMYHRVRKMRETKPIFVMDFWNDGEYVDGCIAGGKSYIHINANGDVEPCAFIHYSNVNIHETSLLEALQSPIMQQYRQNQPFNENHLRPCPLLDNPEKLQMMVHKSGSYSTQPVDHESVDRLADKCRDVSKEWAKRANELWEGVKYEQ